MNIQKRLGLRFVVFLLFVVFSCSLFVPVFIGRVNLNGNLLVSFYSPYGQNLPFKNTGWDQLRIYFPFYKFTFGEFGNWRIPLWNPYAFSGHPHMADFQSGVFYPLNIFGIFLGQIEFWHLLRISPMILGSFFMFLFLCNFEWKKDKQMGSIAAFFGAMTFGFSPFVLTWGEEVVLSVHSIIWLPLMLYFIDRFLKSNKRYFLFFLALAVAATLLGGYMQTTLYLLIFSFAYLLVRVGSKNLFKRNTFLVVSAFVFGGLMALVQLLPSAELFFQSARSEVKLTSTLYQFLIPTHSLITLIVPDIFGNPATNNFFRGGSAQYYEGILFGGIAALMLAVYAVLSIPKNKFVVLFLAAVALSYLTVFDLFTAKIFLILPIPFLSTSIPNRILFIPAFCIAVLGALGLDVYLAAKDKKIIKTLVVFALLYILIIFYLVGVFRFNLPYFGDQAHKDSVISLRNLVVPLAVFVLSSAFLILGNFRPKISKYVGLAIIIVSFGHIFYFSHKYFSFTNRANVFPNDPTLEYLVKNQNNFRSWGAGSASFETNFATQYGILWPEGYDSLNNRAYGEFTYAMQGRNIRDYTFRADAGLGREELQSMFSNEDRRKLVDLVGVKYVLAPLSGRDFLATKSMKLVFENGEVGVFENQTVMPRAFLASGYAEPPSISTFNKTEAQMKKERRALIPQKLLSADFDWRSQIILEEPSPISAQVGAGEVQITSYKPQEVIIETKSDVPKLLFLSDNYYPGWKARVDGKETNILRADYTFRAVPLEAGVHVVRFYLDSSSFKLGLVISILSLVVFGLFTLIPSRQKD